MSPVTVQNIRLYPIKSLDPVVANAARVLPSGALEHDREFALFDEEGKWINGKRDARIHRIRAAYDPDLCVVTLQTPEQSQPRPLHLVDNRQELEDWFGSFFGFPVSMKRNRETGFPDDLESPGPTIVSTATLREICAWFKFKDLEETRRRFRANIEVSGDAPFWEDRLFGSADAIVEFRIGDVTFHGVNPCQRCAVPSRDPWTGVVTPDFQREFTARREKELPPWATKARFNHYYRLSVNTRIPPSEAGKLLRCGDVLEFRGQTTRTPGS